MARFRLEHRISHADVDLVGELKTQALLGLLEQAAVEASTDAGLDPAWYTRAGRFWLVRRTRLERMLPVGGGDIVAVETEVADWRRARSLRRYEVRLCSAGRGIREASPPAGEHAVPGALVARATTDWVYCDMATRRPVSIPEDVRRAFAAGAADDADVSLPRARPLPEAGEGPCADLHLTAQPSHLDHVAHVNNAAYAGWLEDGAFALFRAEGAGIERMLDEDGALRPASFDVEYVVDAVAGDELIVRTWRLAENDARSPDEALAPTGPAASPAAPSARGLAPADLLQTICRDDGRLLVRARSRWTWRPRPRILGGVAP